MINVNDILEYLDSRYHRYTVFRRHRHGHMLVLVPGGRLCITKHDLECRSLQDIVDSLENSVCPMNLETARNKYEKYYEEATYLTIW